MPKPDDGHEARYRYEARPRVIIAADSLDRANEILNRLTGALADDPDVIVARASARDLHHRNDLDGALRS